MKKRNPMMIVLLNVLTCGIYNLIWQYQIQNEFKKQNPELSQPNGLGLILLSMLTCGFYTIYWYYLIGANMEMIYNRVEKTYNTNKSKYLIICVVSYLLTFCCGIGLIGFVLLPIIIQTDINSMIIETGIESVENNDDKIMFS